MQPSPGTAASAWALPLVLQTYTAVYYVLADLVMLTLYFHYKFKKRPSPCECSGRSGSAAPLAARRAWHWGGSRVPIAG